MMADKLLFFMKWETFEIGGWPIISLSALNFWVSMSFYRKYKKKLFSLLFLSNPFFFSFSFNSTKTTANQERWVKEREHTPLVFLVSIWLHQSHLLIIVMLLPTLSPPLLFPNPVQNKQPLWTQLKDGNHLVNPRWSMMISNTKWKLLLFMSLSVLISITLSWFFLVTCVIFSVNFSSLKHILTWKWIR